MNFSIDKDEAANRVERTVSCFKEGFSRSQAILTQPRGEIKK